MRYSEIILRNKFQAWTYFCLGELLALLVDDKTVYEIHENNTPRIQSVSEPAQILNTL